MTFFYPPSNTSPDPLGAFVAQAPYALNGYGTSSLRFAEADKPALDGLTLGVKDLFDVAGLKTGAGSPDWLAQANTAMAHAPCVTALLDAGARFVGKTLTDELAWSLNGENAHYGTPVNLAAPGRVPGGSSAGSAAAVAGHLIDIGLGSDTGGSVRLPASYCGVWGFRPTHGRIDLAGTVPLAVSFDTVGWFARTAEILAMVGTVLLENDETLPSAGRLILADDMMARVDPDLRQALTDKAGQVARRLGLSLDHANLVPKKGAIAGVPGDLSAWRDVFRVCQSAEAWQAHGTWVETVHPDLGPGVKDRFAYAKGLGADEIEAAKAAREAIAAYLTQTVPAGTLVLVPGAAGVAPPKGLEGPVLDDIRARALDLLNPAGLGRLPQLALPALDPPDGPVGLGLIGWSGSDTVLLRLAAKLERL